MQLQAPVQRFGSGVAGDGVQQRQRRGERIHHDAQGLESLGGGGEGAQRRHAQGDQRQRREEMQVRPLHARPALGVGGVVQYHADGRDDQAGTVAGLAGAQPPDQAGRRCKVGQRRQQRDQEFGHRRSVSHTGRGTRRGASARKL